MKCKNAPLLATRRTTTSNETTSDWFKRLRRAHIHAHNRFATIVRGATKRKKRQVSTFNRRALTLYWRGEWGGIRHVDVASPTIVAVLSAVACVTVVVCNVNVISSTVLLLRFDYSILAVKISACTSIFPKSLLYLVYFIAVAVSTVYILNFSLLRAVAILIFFCIFLCKMCTKFRRRSRCCVYP